MNYRDIKQMFKDYTFWQFKLEMLKERYEELDSYTGVQSAKMDIAVRGGDKLSLTDIIEKKDKIEKEMNEIKHKAMLFDKMLDCLDQDERKVLFALYSNNPKFKYLNVNGKARELMMSRAKMFRISEKALKKISELLN